MPARSAKVAKVCRNRTRPLLFECGECDRLQRHRPQAPFSLGALQATLRERAADVDDARLAIDVAPFKREPFGWAKSGRGREDRHWPVARREIRGDRLEFGLCLERALLRTPRRRVIDAELCRVDVDHPPDDRA
jgi:hypothetical protein